MKCMHSYSIVTEFAAKSSVATWRHLGSDGRSCCIWSCILDVFIAQKFSCKLLLSFSKAYSCTTIYTMNLMWCKNIKKLNVSIKISLSQIYNSNWHLWGIVKTSKAINLTQCLEEMQHWICLADSGIEFVHSYSQFFWNEQLDGVQKQATKCFSLKCSHSTNMWRGNNISRTVKC